MAKVWPFLSSTVVEARRVSTAGHLGELLPHAFGAGNLGRARDAAEPVAEPVAEVAAAPVAEVAAAPVAEVSSESADGIEKTVSELATLEAARRLL